MSIQEKPDFNEEEISSQQVADFLQAHPGYFEDHPELVNQLRIRHHTGAAVSLIEYQVHNLRDQNAQLKLKLRELVSVARINDRLSERVMRLALTLMETSSVEDALTLIDERMRVDFNADEVVLHLFDDNNSLPEDIQQCSRGPRDGRVEELFANLLKTYRPLCGRLKTEQLEYLFGERADSIKSAVLIPLGRHAGLGMLAIGSTDPNRYHPGMGTVFLKQMGALISTVLRCHLG